ncbi:MAG: CRISPR/Cas system-associated exonuclease Cas4 (RecB family) [Oleiphilaceae bacterium]|jgi:CRISPR/Cas system-associated exonuclease Cas4 (RecB family)
MNFSYINLENILSHADFTIEWIVLGVVFASITLIIMRLIYRFVRGFFPKTYPKNRLGIEGELIWVDESKDTKPFFNNKYKVFGKPDFIYKRRSGATAVEYKSRFGKVYESDIVQAKTAALAARGAGIKIDQIMIKTERDTQILNLPKRNKDLFIQIEGNIREARKAKLGIRMNARPNKIKCRACSHKNTCTKKFA